MINGRDNRKWFGAYLQLQWITHSMGLAMLDCFVKAGVWLHVAVTVASDKDYLIMQQYMYSHFQIDQIFMLK